MYGFYYPICHSREACPCEGRERESRLYLAPGSTGGLYSAAISFADELVAVPHPENCHVREIH